MTATTPAATDPPESVIPDPAAIRARLQQVRAEARVLAGILRAMEGYPPVTRPISAESHVRQGVARAG